MLGPVACWALGAPAALARLWGARVPVAGRMRAPPGGRLCLAFRRVGARKSGPPAGKNPQP